MSSPPVDPSLRRIRLVVEYDGTDYCGWQRQENGPSIQAELEAAVERITGARTLVAGAGRTDAGVHALGQVAAFSTASPLSPDRLRRGLCAVLPPAISVVAADEVDPAFDPRRHARGKIYRYRIWNARSRSPIESRFSWHRVRPLDLAAMNQAASALLGAHDFSAFRAADCERRSTVRHVSRFEVRRDGPLLIVEIEATAFLKNMVRILVGTLHQVGIGRLDAAAIPSIVERRDRTLAGPTAPPEGLFLVQVFYETPPPPRA